MEAPRPAPAIYPAGAWPKGSATVCLFCCFAAASFAARSSADREPTRVDGESSVSVVGRAAAGPICGHGRVSLQRVHHRNTRYYIHEHIISSLTSDAVTKPAAPRPRPAT